MLNAEKLSKLHISADWVDPLNETFERFGIVTRNQQAVFIGQASHESGNFKLLEENLNYKAATLMRIWPKRFPTLERANEFSGNPRKIANSVYSLRMGNRDENSGDGWRFMAGEFFSLLATRMCTMLARPWVWTLLKILTLLLLLSMLLSQLVGFGLPTTSIHQRMPLIMPR